MSWKGEAAPPAQRRDQTNPVVVLGAASDTPTSALCPPWPRRPPGDTWKPSPLSPGPPRAGHGQGEAAPVPRERPFVPSTGHSACLWHLGTNPRSMIDSNPLYVGYFLFPWRLIPVWEQPLPPLYQINDCLQSSLHGMVFISTAHPRCGNSRCLHLIRARETLGGGILCLQMQGRPTGAVTCLLGLGITRRVLDTFSLAEIPG